MAPEAEKVLAQALQLSREQRTEVVDRLLQSLDDEEGDALDEQDREKLHAAIARSEAQFRAGEGIPADEALAQLERLRKR